MSSACSRIASSMTGSIRRSPPPQPVHISTYLGKSRAGLRDDRDDDAPAALHHARKALPRIRAEYEHCSAASGRSWSTRSPGRRAMATGRRMATISTAANGCARSTGG